MKSGSRLRINTPAVVSEIFEDEMVIINLDNGNYYSTNKVAADIWSSIERGRDEREIMEGIRNRYQGNPEEMEGAVTRFISELMEEKLIVPAETETTRIAAGSNTPTGSDAEKEKLIFTDPVLTVYNDMQQLLLLDPVHEVDKTGWPDRKPEDGR